MANARPTNGFLHLTRREQTIIVAGSLVPVAGFFVPVAMLTAGIVRLDGVTATVSLVLAIAAYKLAKRLRRPAREACNPAPRHPSLSPLAPAWAHVLLSELDQWDGTVMESSLAQDGEVQPRPFDWERDSFE